MTVHHRHLRRRWPPLEGHDPEVPHISAHMPIRPPCYMHTCCHSGWAWDLAALWVGSISKSTEVSMALAWSPEGPGTAGSTTQPGGEHHSARRGAQADATQAACPAAREGALPSVSCWSLTSPPSHSINSLHQMWCPPDHPLKDQTHSCSGPLHLLFLLSQSISSRDPRTSLASLFQDLPQCHSLGRPCRSPLTKLQALTLAVPPPPTTPCLFLYFLSVLFPA